MPQLWQDIHAHLSDTPGDWFLQRRVTRSQPGIEANLTTSRVHGDALSALNTELTRKGYSCVASTTPSSFYKSAGFTSTLPATSATETEFLSTFRPAMLVQAETLQDLSETGRLTQGGELLLSHLCAAVTHSELVDRAIIPSNELFVLRAFSLRSHFEGYLARASNPGRTTQQFAAAFTRVKDPFGELVHQVFQQKSLQTEAANLWHDSELRGASTIREQIATGTLFPSTAPFPELTDDGGTFRLPSARFETAEIYREHLNHFLHHTVDFQVFRLLSSLTYEALHDLGFSLPERYFLCYSLWEAISMSTGTTQVEALDQIRELAIHVDQESALTPLPR